MHVFVFGGKIEGALLCTVRMTDKVHTTCSTLVFVASMSSSCLSFPFHVLASCKMVCHVGC